MLRSAAGRSKNELRQTEQYPQIACITTTVVVSFSLDDTMMLLAGLLTIGLALFLWVRALGRRHRRRDLGAVSAQWLMTYRIERTR
jgi:hypothetical protein